MPKPYPLGYAGALALEPLLHWIRRTVRLLDRILPTAQEAWQFGVAALIPLLVLCGERLWLVSRMSAKPAGWDRLWIMLGELEFWGFWFAVWMLLSRVPLRFWKGSMRFLMHLGIAVILGGSAAELNFWEVTGSRADLDTVAFGIADFARVWPVVASEIHTWQIAAAAGVVLLTLLPLIPVRLVAERRWWSRLFILLLIPGLYNETQGRIRPSKSMKALQKTFVEILYWEAVERSDDVFYPPDPEELVLLEVSAPTTPKNIVLIFAESIGHDRTTLGNPELPTTPTMLRLGEQGLVADKMTAMVTHTTKALITGICGDWPNLTGDARDARPGGLPPRCLPELLGEQGYRTAFFQTARQDFEDRVDLVHQMGFDTFRHRDSLNGTMWERNNYFGIDDRAMLAPGLAWTAAEPGTPFFSTYLTLASHHDYKLPKHWQLLDFPKVTGRLERYFNSIRYVDDFIDRLVRGHEERGLAENTVFIIVGDHGEGFGEHGRYQHDLLIYEEGLHIPFVMYGKGLDGRVGRIEGNRQQIDILPTVLDLIGSTVEKGATRGSSLLEPQPQGRVLYHSCWRAHRCIARRDGDQKFIDHFSEQAAQAFDVRADPRERKDLARKLSPEVRDALRGDTRRFYGAVRGLFDARQAAYFESVQRPDDTPAFATWDSSLSLIGCEAEQTTVIPGEAVWVTCRWRPEQPLTTAWTLAVQAKVGASRTGSEDWTPFMGALKMWNWVPGSSIDDTFRVDIPMYSRAGEAVVSVAWKRITGQIVQTDDGRERVDVAKVTVVSRGPPTEAGVEGITVAPLELPASFNLPLLGAQEGADEAEPAGDLDADPPVDDDRAATPAP